MRDPSFEREKACAYDLLAGADAALEEGQIDEAEWHRRIAAVITPAHLATDNPRAQAGNSGDKAHWRHVRGLIADAVNRNGTFLDVGCAIAT